MAKVSKKVLPLTRGQLWMSLRALNEGKFEDPISSAFRYMKHYNIEAIRKEWLRFEELFPEPQAYVDYRSKEAEIFRKYNIPYGVPIDPATLNPEAKALAESELIVLQKETENTRNECREAMDNRIKELNVSPELELVVIGLDDAPVVATEQPNYLTADMVYANAIHSFIHEP